jgi:hypothetical protein
MLLYKVNGKIKSQKRKISLNLKAREEIREKMGRRILSYTEQTKGPVL